MSTEAVAADASMSSVDVSYSSRKGTKGMIASRPIGGTGAVDFVRDRQAAPSALDARLRRAAQPRPARRGAGRSAASPPRPRASGCAGGRARALALVGALVPPPELGPADRGPDGVAPARA